MDENFYKVGDSVWYASFDLREEKVPCPVCYGNRSVIVVLGNGDEVQVECDYCGKGWESAKGYVIEYVQLPRAEYMVITKRRIEEVSGSEEIEYQSDHFLLKPERMFETEYAALACAEEMAEQDKLDKANKPKYKNEKSYTWNVGYHLKLAKSKYTEAQYHEEKAKICKSRVKQKGD